MANQDIKARKEMKQEGGEQEKTEKAHRRKETTGEQKQQYYTRLPVNFSSRVDIASHERGAIASDGHP